MLDQHVLQTIRPAVCDLSSTRRTLGKMATQAESKELTLRRRIQNHLDGSLQRLIKREFAKSLRPHVGFCLMGIEGGGTGPLRLIIRLSPPKDELSNEQKARIEAFYSKFKEECRTSLAAVNEDSSEKLILLFQDSGHSAPNCS